MVPCGELGLFSAALVANDGSRFKAVSTRDNNFTVHNVKRRIERVARLIVGIGRIRIPRRAGGPGPRGAVRAAGPEDRSVRAQMAMLKTIQAEVEASPDGRSVFGDPSDRSTSNIRRIIVSA
ncbi:MAG: hypothetical protein KJ916_00300 [Alphaproteobacteria bacterium]|nr:hypothetical protein [Alphaproteobacteria bacterium]